VERVNSRGDHLANHLKIKIIVAIQQFQGGLHQMVRTIAAASDGFHHRFPV
jgi:hypothetical protein